MPNILFMADSLALGGTERQLTLLVKYLPSPWNASVVAFGGGMFTPKIIELGVDVVVFERRTRLDLKPVWSFWKLLRKLRPDIVHSWGGLSSAIAAPMCKLLGIRFINGSIRSGSAVTRHIIRTLITFFLSDWIIANSYAGLKACGISGPKGKVIYNALDPQRLIPIDNYRYKMKPPITVVMAARMTAQKDFMMFINGAREISHRDSENWKFVALGDGKDKELLIEEAADLISMEIMEFPDVLDDVIPFLQQTDIGVLLTNTKLIKEGLSNAIMEYMACGIPVICKNTGGNSELVISGETGFLLELDNVHNFVEKLLWLAHHPDKARHMGEDGKKRIEELCSIERMVGEYIDVYRDVLKITNAP